MNHQIEPSVCDGVEPASQSMTLDSKPKHKEPNPENVACWKAYAKAYRYRYGLFPVTNAKTRGQAAQLVKYVGGDIAMQLATYYVSHPDAWYVKNRHEFGLLLRDYQRVLTDMQRNETMTQTQARQAERTQTNLNSFQQVINEFRAQEKMNHG